MKKAQFEIKGTKPILYHRFNLESITNTKKPKEGNTGNNPSEWKETVWHEGTKLYFPSFYMHSAIIAGGKHVKIGRGTLSKNIAACLTIEEEKLYLLNRELPKPIDELTNEILGTDSSKPVYLDIRGVSNPNTKGKNVRYRVAVSPGWEMKVKIEWDDTIASMQQVKECVVALGKYVGFSNGRTLGYGRFELVDFKII